jgi:hypothetical protein
MGLTATLQDPAEALEQARAEAAGATREAETTRPRHVSGSGSTS